MMARLLAEDQEEKARSAAKSKKKKKKGASAAPPAGRSAEAAAASDAPRRDAMAAGKPESPTPSASASEVRSGFLPTSSKPKPNPRVSLLVPSNDGAAAPAAAAVLAAAPVALDMPPSPPPTAVTSLADAQFSTGRPEPPESTIGGQATCIICFTNLKSHIAVPCGHQCACADCSAQMHECPVCRTRVQMWMQVRVA